MNCLHLRSCCHCRLSSAASRKPLDNTFLRPFLWVTSWKNCADVSNTRRKNITFIHVRKVHSDLTPETRHGWTCRHHCPIVVTLRARTTIISAQLVMGTRPTPHPCHLPKIPPPPRPSASHLWRNRKADLAVGNRAYVNNDPSPWGQRVINGLTAKA